MKNLHPLQSEKWGEFRKKTGVKVVNINNLQITIHNLPHTNYKIGYLPKGPQINKKMLDELYNFGKKENCIFIQLEPNIEKSPGKDYEFKNLVSSAHPLFTKYNFVLDITKSEDELLKNMNQKTRYNIRLAEKKGVKIIEDNSDKTFNEYLKLTNETTTRQKFYAHSNTYHKLMWETLRQVQGTPFNQNELSAHLFKAVYNGEVLATWILFVLGDTLYYPYGASSDKNREVMASNLMMWEVIRFGKKLGLKKFDMWGALGPNPNPKDPWYGFNKFKEGYSGKLVEYVGSYDLIINKKLYFLFKLANNLRWALLKLK
jgi:lipid II:glycine glycyltransferase (peptidoglycan interpeptide bridge formation enzyme)